VMISLIGCAKATSDLEIYCPSVSQYTQEFQNKLADELQSLPSDTAISEALTDYIVLRDKIRKCQQIEDKI